MEDSLGGHIHWLMKRRSRLEREIAKVHSALELAGVHSEERAREERESDKVAPDSDATQGADSAPAAAPSGPSPTPDPEPVAASEPSDEEQEPATPPEPAPSSGTLADRVAHVVGRSDRPLTARQVSDTLFGKHNSSVPSVLFELVKVGRLFRKKGNLEDGRSVWHYWRTDEFPKRGLAKVRSEGEKITPPPPGRHLRTPS